MATAAIIEEAISECEEFADDEILNEWRLEKRAANREGIEEEMKQMSLEPDDEFLSILGEVCDTLVGNFEQSCKDESPEAAFAALIDISWFIPPSESGRSTEDQDSSEDFGSTSLRDIFPKRLVKPEGDSVPEERSDLNVDEAYPVQVRIHHSVLLRVLYRVMEQDLLKEANLYRLLNSIPGATEDDKAFLTDFFAAFFEGRHVEAIHLGLPRLEGLTKHQLENSGVAVTSQKNGEDLPKSLGGLFNLLDVHLDDDYLTFLKFRFTDDLGPEIRNQVAHGSIGYREANWNISASVLIELFRLSIRIDRLED